MKVDIEKFNEENPVGKIISFHNEKGVFMVEKIRFPAELTESGKAIVWVATSYDALPLDKVIK